ncbi:MULTISPECIES: UDP-2,3-diacylglucosamine diphosphatase [unclassified Nitratiruptor]|uniref:UDP-2,3-diacylglucosamine diphosphatase n=1 Tax=unclassified Nitratiruptor TaxID=2624044 RepID=UPI001915664A|nr:MULTISPECIES: UDP-2,3-diacylglucosamine diphosphatase [unclassified Nitratiruptor]BCD60627.1 UDP-2,3-diacylglucosamine hydrolase [Nitratiruptor sp. YY08-10]BCD64558.1 UDP-2,3-diacylglucosamine hydrolase [Nitratiruptor sp. YY08-14]
MFLKEGAVFIADAHYHRGIREEFIQFVQQIDTPQLFLMGDIFDLLVGGIKATLEENRDVIALLNAVSKKIECIYLEGNHDFHLNEVFPFMKVIPLSLQPLYLQSPKGCIALSHGDTFIAGTYAYYAKIIRNPIVITILNAINVGNWLSNKIQTYNRAKKLCKKIEDFETIACKRVLLYQCDTVIEGHYHQNLDIECDKKRYINLPSFACSKEFMQYKNGAFITLKM